MLDRITTYAPGGIGVSAITEAELEHGVINSRQPRRNREALEQFLSPLEVVAFHRAATVAYGRLGAHLEKRGSRIGSMELLIAAHALSADVPLATSNTGEFTRVPGLRVENWAAAK